VRCPGGSCPQRCISSTGPVLSDAKPVLRRARPDSASLPCPKGRQRIPAWLSFQWSGSRYLVRGKSIGYSEFTAYPYEGRDSIVQGTTQRAPSHVEYGVARKLANGVYLLVAINEDDADEPDARKILHQDARCLLPNRKRPSSFSSSRGRAPTNRWRAVAWRSWSRAATAQSVKSKMGTRHRRHIRAEES